MWSKGLTIAQPQTHAINPADFTTNIDNPFMPQKPGTTFVYEDKAAHTIDYVVVTHHTQVIDGVTCVVVHDYELENGQLSEDTKDYLAQDSDGNVWYFGEHSRQYENGHVVGREGSWIAGVNGAEGGIVMEANPQVGDVYAEENASNAQDMAKIISLHESASVTYGAFGNLLETKNFSPLEPDVTEHKWYAAGVGNVLSTDNEGAYEQLVQIKLDGGAGQDTLIGFSGRDTITARRGSDVLAGLDGRDLMYGGGGTDYAAGGRNGDLINGGTGNDVILGENGKDVLIGGPGNDIMTGGHGADRFVFTETDGSAVDLITDYSLRQGDAIVVTGGEAGVAYDARVDGTWQLVLNDGHVIQLLGVHDREHNHHVLDNVNILDVGG